MSSEQAVGKKSVKVAAVLCLIVVLLCFVPPRVLAATDHGGHWGWLEPLGRWVNLAILFGIIYYFTREPIARFFRSRREGIQRELAEAKAAREEAERKLAAVEERVRQLDGEASRLRDRALAEADAERDRILGQAEREAAKILAAAEREIQGLTLAARQELRAYVAELSVGLARMRIESRLDDETRDRVVERFFVKLTSREGGKLT